MWDIIGAAVIVVLFVVILSFWGNAIRQTQGRDRFGLAFLLTILTFGFFALLASCFT